MRMNVYLPRHIDQESQAFLDFIRWQRIELLHFIRCHRIKNTFSKSANPSGIPAECLTLLLYTTLYNPSLRHH